MKKIVFLFTIVQFLIACNEIRWGGGGNDIDLWRDTEIWEFAKLISNGTYEKAEVMLEDNKIDIDFREPKYGETLLSWAVQNDNLEAVKFLVDHGANPNAHDTYFGRSPMVFAAEEFNSIEILRYLLGHGGNPNDCANDREILKEGPWPHTPLIGAAFISMEKTKMLVEAGGDPNFAVEPGFTSFTQASMRNKLDVLEYLLRNCRIDYGKSYIVTQRKDTLFLKENIKNDEVVYQMDSVRVKRILKYLDIIQRETCSPRDCPVSKDSVR